MRADLNDFAYFAEVVAHGGFSAAARVLKEPKSKLSRRIFAEAIGEVWRLRWEAARGRL